MEKVSKVEETSKEVLRIAQKNEADIFTIKNQQDNIKSELEIELLETMKKDIKHHEVIRKLEVQLKGAMMELEDFCNLSMRSTLIFKIYLGNQRKHGRILVKLKQILLKRSLTFLTHVQILTWQ